MDKRLANRILEDFPALFKYSPDQSRLPFPMFGFETQSGWFPLIYQACKEMDLVRCELGVEVQITQIKEKFGYLCLYNRGPEEALDIELTAADKSQHICDVCGREGKLRNDVGWYSTRCDAHMKGRHETPEAIIEQMLQAVGHE